MTLYEPSCKWTNALLQPSSMQSQQVLSVQEEVFSNAAWQQPAPSSLTSPSNGVMTSPATSTLNGNTSSPTKAFNSDSLVNLDTGSVVNNCEWKADIKWNDRESFNDTDDWPTETGATLTDFDLSKLTTTDETLLEDLHNIMKEELTDVGPDTIEQVLSNQMMISGRKISDGTTPSAQQLAAHVLQVNKSSLPANGVRRARQGPLMTLLSTQSQQQQQQQQHQSPGLLMPHPAYRGTEAWQQQQQQQYNPYADDQNGHSRLKRPSGVDSACSSSNGDDSPMDYSFAQDGNGTLPVHDSGDNSSVGSAGSSNGQNYWWQYNVQCKGPKGKRLCQPVEAEDPYKLHEFEDPVFDPENPVDGIRHGGKARKGDGNDITPNPRRLFMIGQELEKLNDSMRALAPAMELPQDDPRANKARREKNKLASRVCRLKKKAQHEAHKVKLGGLDREHHGLIDLIERVKKEIFARLRLAKDDKSMLVRSVPLTDIVGRIIASQPIREVAGRTSDHVNWVLEQETEKERQAQLARNRLH